MSYQSVLCVLILSLLAIEGNSFVYADAPAIDSGPVWVDNDSSDANQRESKRTYSKQNSRVAEVSNSTEASQESNEHRRSLAVAALLYIPSRVLDAVDIFRARVRVGPGFSVGVRATDAAQAYVGGYSSIYAGLPGPRRGQQIPRSPIGLESRAGAAVSVADATVSGGMDPGYSSAEFDVGVQAGVLGAELGIDPVEIADFVVGIFGFDIQGDDL